ncbi:dTDP-4-dehydrorhamnose reductase [bacterium A37T11]|nr:dTDP-4-dehydrorhamnose reductase [bacterium A37T11]
MKILVTGSNGLLGQKLTELLLSQQDISLIATCRGENRFPKTQGYHYEKMDITDPTVVANVIASHRPDVVINTAAMTNVDICHQDPEGCSRLNVVAVQTLVEVCNLYDVHLIQLSTDFVFDGENGPYREEDQTNPISIYGQSKWDAEQLIAASSSSWCIIRTILVYGVVRDGSRSNIVLWAKESLENDRVINVVNDQWRMPTLAEDLAMACLAAAKHRAQGIFHVSGDELMSIRQLVRTVADYWKLNSLNINPVSSDALNQQARRPIRTGFVLDKARDILGYQPRSFEDGLALVDTQLHALLMQK